MPDRLCTGDDNRYEQYSSVNKVNDAVPRASDTRLAPTEAERRLRIPVGLRELQSNEAIRGLIFMVVPATRAWKFTPHPTANFLCSQHAVSLAFCERVYFFLNCKHVHKFCQDLFQKNLKKNEPKSIAQDFDPFSYNLSF